jgi:hypothetical protein
VDVVWHDNVPEKLAGILISIIIQAVDNWNDKGWACEYANPVIDVAGDIEN